MGILDHEWHVVTTPPAKKVEVVIIPESTRKLMHETTARDVYLWSRNHEIVKRLPRKIKKCLYYGGRSKLFIKAGIVLIKMWNEYECNRNLD